MVTDSTQPPATGPGTAKRRSRRRLRIALGVLAGIVVLGGLVGLVAWSLTRPPPRALSDREALMQQRDAWVSAMRKASVDATFPTAPVEITSLDSAGGHPFEATFTAEEITALVTVYRYVPAGQSMSLSRVSVRFPSAGEAVVSGRAVINGSAYSAEISGPAGYENGSIVAQGPVNVSVEGFGVGGERGRQATEAVLAYLNEFLDAAPGLTLDTAEITAEGVRISGRAPDSLLNPPPAERAQ
jgi:hypothetical protein